MCVVPSMCDWPTFSKRVMHQLMCLTYVLIDIVDKPLLGFILWSDSWGVDVLPDYIVSSSALIPLAPNQDYISTI